MSTFTDKEMIKEIKERIGSLDVRDNIERRAYEIALASLEAEPVAWQVTITKDGQDSASTIYRDCAEKDTWVRIHETLGSVVHVTPLYMAPPAPVIQADVAQAIENLKQKLVECNRYNYCADAVKGVEDACRATMLHGVKPVSQTYKLNKLFGNSPVTPDGWVMVPKQVTPEISNAINVVGQRCTCGNCSQRLWDLLLDATQQGVNRG
ncbi:TPA: DUF551 domain-containing protein [Escherichia coli]|nr:DUF551 domain-containing protein [Escherichia coli]EME6053682.1 DUF551 domain-containing protein [Escherichia coli]HBU6098803.1 DUF551 domain-containing protein [Escherichia coli]HCP3191193.1 DUF551 domain-containing protein [Escherichia coli]HCW1402831.1 DUF551 domain-containing protein [Escherichia coli]